MCNPTISSITYVLDYWGKSHKLKGNATIGQFGNCLTHPNGYIKTRTDFWQNKLEKLQIKDARSLHKYKTQLFSKSYVLY